MPGRALACAIALAAIGAGCHPSGPTATRPPPGPTACARAADSMVGAMLARLSAPDAPPTEQADALRNLIRERCERDAWSADATRCLIAMRELADAEPCAKLLTEDQQAALVRDQAAMARPPAPPTN